MRNHIWNSPLSSFPPDPPPYVSPLYSASLFTNPPPVPQPTKKNKKKNKKPKNSKTPLDSTPSSPPPKVESSEPQGPSQHPRALLTLKTYDPVSGTCLKYKTDKAAEVGRLVTSLGRCGRVMAALPVREETENNEKLAEETEGVAAVKTEDTRDPTNKGKSKGGQAQGKGGEKGGGGGGGGGGKKKKGKKS